MGLKGEPQVRGRFAVSIRGYLFAPLPALLAGVYVMHRSGVGTSLLAAQLVYGILGIAVFAGAVRLGHRLFRHPAPLLWFGTVALFLPLLGSGSSGVFRWIHAGPVVLHVGALVCPGMIVGMSLRPSWGGIGATLAAMVVLAVQSDAGQASALGAGLAILGLHCRGFRRFVLVVPPLTLAFVTWTRPDPLAPVAHVENILSLAWTTHAALFVVAVVTLTFVPGLCLHSWWRYRRNDGVMTRTYASVAAYVVTTVIAPAFGHFPVPLLGYGAGPIIGTYGLLGLLGGLAYRPEVEGIDT